MPSEFTFRLLFLLGRRRPVISFNKKSLTLRRGKPVHYLRIGSHVHKYRNLVKHMKIKFLRRWRQLKDRNGRLFIRLRRGWRRVRRKVRRWYVRNKKRWIRLRRNFNTFKILVHKKYRPAMRLGRTYFVRIGRRTLKFWPRYTWFAKRKGHILRVRRRGRLAYVRKGGKWSEAKQIRFPRTNKGKNK